MTLTRRPKRTKRAETSPKRVSGCYIVIGDNKMIDLFDGVDTACKCAQDFSLRTGIPASVWAKCPNILTPEEIYNTMLDTSFVQYLKQMV